MPIRLLCVRALLACGIIVCAFVPPALADRAFVPRFTTNDTGDITFAAAPLMTCSTTGTNGGQCAATRALSAPNGPVGTNSVASQSNNNYTMVSQDSDGDPATTVNSSTAALALPASATVLFAGLYWGADQAAGNNGGAPPDPATPNANQARFKPAGGTYSTLTAATIDFGTGGNTTRYQAFADVTAAVQAAGAGTYAVGDVRAASGGDRYAGWTLVVAYRDTAQPARNLTVFDGFRSIASNSPPVAIPVSGFRTPPAGPVRTTLGLVAYEGDLGLGGDSASLNSTTLANPANGATNFFNSSISSRGVAVATRTPAYTNTLGYDSDLFVADGILANNATDATIRVTTSQDQYLPGVITFATELFAPVAGLQKAVTNLTHPGAEAQRGDVLRYTVTAANTGQDGADGFVLSDPIPAGTTYVAGSLTVAGTSRTDAFADDTADFDASGNRAVFRLGTGATATQGGRLAAASAVTVGFDVRISDVLPRTEIVNAAAARFVTQSLTVPLGADSNQVVTRVAAPDLALAKTHAPAYVSGARSTIRLIVSNVGNLVTDGSAVTVTDTMPADSFSSLSNPGGAGWSCSIAGLTITCTRTDPLAAGDSYPPIVFDATVQSTAPASIVNTATVAGGGNVDTSNDTASDVGATAQRADVRITKDVAPDTVTNGGHLRYTLAVENLGPSTATSVSVTDPLGGSYADVAVATTRGTCTAAVDCALGDLAAGESATITVDATVLANATTLTNTASVTSLSPEDPNPGNNTATANVVVPNSADLRLTKTQSTDTPVAGAPDGLTYTLTVTNDGPGAASDVLLSDEIPAEFTPTVITPSGGLTCNAPGAGGQLVCTAATLAASATEAVTLTGTVIGSAQAVVVRNLGRVTSTTIDPDPANNDHTTVAIGAPAADLAVTKEWGTEAGAFTQITTAPATTNVRVRLGVTNLGPSTATGVVLTDVLPANITYVSDDGGCGAVAQTVTCAVGSLAAGAQFVVLVTVNLGVGAAGTIVSNTASVGGAEADPIGSNDTATDIIGVGAVADLALTKIASAGAASVGDTVTFTLTATNNGPGDTTGVVITDALPADFEFVFADPGCVHLAGTVTCSVGALASGASATVMVVARATVTAAGATHTNTAATTSDLPDPEPANNTAGADVAVAPQTDLSLTKTANHDPTGVDQVVTYTLTVSNAGPNDATGVEIEDVLAVGVTFVSAPGCSFDATTRIVLCSVGDLANGASRTVTITVRPGSDLALSTLTNSATVTGDQDDPDGGNNQQPAVVAVLGQVDLSLTKTASASLVAAGGSLAYTLVVTNAGPSPATGTTITDALPAGTTVTSITSSQGTCTAEPGVITCLLGTLAVGASAQVVVVLVAPSAPDVALTNSASVAAAEPDVRPQDNQATSTTTVSAGLEKGSPATLPPDLVIRKTVDRATATTADRVRYTITVQNRGAGAAQNVVVTDTFNRPAVVVSARATAGSCTRSAPTVCTIGGLAAGGSVTITIVAWARTSGTLSNTASVTAAGGAAATAIATTRISQARARLGIATTASRKVVPSSGVFTYTLRVRNRSSVVALDVRVCDVLPRGLTYVRTTSGAVLRGRRVCWRAGALDGGKSHTFTLTVRADRADVAHSIVNVGHASADNARGVNDPARVRILAAGAGRPGGVTW